MTAGWIGARNIRLGQTIITQDRDTPLEVLYVETWHSGFVVVHGKNQMGPLAVKVNDGDIVLLLETAAVTAGPRLEYALEGAPGRLTAPFPVYDTYEDAARAASAPVLSKFPPRILVREAASPWRVA